MPPFHTLLPGIIAFLSSSKYALIFLGCFFEGSVAMITTGVLWHLGLVTFWRAFATLIVADMLADMCWYALGRYAARPVTMHIGRYFGITPENIKKVEVLFHTHHTKILLISKLTMGFGLAAAVLSVAGMLRIPLKRYVLINLLGGLLWISVLMGIGYLFGNVLALVPLGYKIALGAGALIAVVVGMHFLTKKMAGIVW